MMSSSEVKMYRQKEKKKAASCWSRMTLYSRQSSAKSLTEEETLEGRSLRTRNIRGPSTVPCGTLDVTAARDVVFQSRATC